MAVNEVYKIMHDSIFHTLSPIKTIGPLGSTVNAPIAVCTNNNCLLYLFCRYQCISRCRSMGGLEPISRTTGAAVALGNLTGDFGSFSAMPSRCSRRSISLQTSSGRTPAAAHRTVKL